MIRNKENDQQPALLHVEPVLGVHNILETVTYWQEVLCFPNKWTWGDPPTHGGVSWHGAAFVQFSLNRGLAAIAEGHAVWIRVRNLEALYMLHQEKKAKIVAPIVNRQWGFAEYTVQDINGYYVNFSSPVADRKSHAEKILTHIRIIARPPILSEYQKLAASVGWSPSGDNKTMETQLQSTVLALVAEDTQTKETIACAFLLGDNRSIYYIKDVIVHPTCQGKGIGTMLMQELVHWLEANAPDGATVGLFTGDHLASFYRQFGFTQACGMYRQINRQQKN